MPETDAFSYNFLFIFYWYHVKLLKYLLMNFHHSTTITQKILEIKAEMAHTQKNKATEGHLDLLKATLSKLLENK